jgi:hypothetical protein
LELAFLKSIEGASALRLAAIGVDHRCRKPLAYQVLGQALGSALGA